MNGFLITLFLIITLILLILIYYIFLYNKINESIIRIEEAEARIDNNLRDKYDLLNRSISLIRNKIDLPQKINDKDLKDFKNIIKISTLNDIGIEDLKQRIIEMYNLEELEGKDLTYLTNARSLSLLNQGLEAINEVKKGIISKQPIDMIEIDLKRIWELLGEITGETYQEELINQLFSQFCLGK